MSRRRKQSTQSWTSPILPSLTAANARWSTAWNQFWFAPAPVGPLTAVRIGVSCVVAIWFLSFLIDGSAWFGADGLLPTSLAALLVAFEETPRWQHWSPLWWTDNLLIYQLYLCAGAALAGLAAAGLGGRLTLVALLVLMIGWVHRITWLQGPVEPALIAMVGYLIVSPGQTWRGPASEPNMHWLHNVALRLIQTHWWILVAAGLLMQLANIVWWRGEAMWWLAASGRSHLLTSDSLGGSASFVNSVTHGIILVQMAALWLLVVPAARPIGIVCGLLSALCLGLLADQTLYALLLAIGLIAYWPRPLPSK